MTGKYVSIRECEARDKALHGKLDMILDSQRRYEEKHDVKHDKIDTWIGQYRGDRNKILGGVVIVSTVVGLLVKLWR